MTRARSIALVNPLGDYGLGSYAHELAGGLVGCGVPTDVFAPGLVETEPFLRHHGFFPVLGSPLLRQRHRLDGRRRPPSQEPAPSHAKSAGRAEAPSRERHPLLDRARQAVVAKLV